MFLDGKALCIGARAFDVIQLLYARKGQIVSKREILETAWPGMIVEENNLQVQISNLRRVLGHDAIATIPGLGYQLTWPDPPAPDPQAPPAPAASPVNTGQNRAKRHHARHIGIALACLATLAALWTGLRSNHPDMTSPRDASAASATDLRAPRSVAVLPFSDMSEHKDLGYLSEGISEELLNLLSRIPDLRVAARTSSFSFRDKSEDLPSIARKLQVAYVLEGSVRRSGNSVRISAQLVRADSGYQVWTQTYDRQLGDLFQVQEEIAAAVTQQLQRSLLGQATAPVATDGPRQGAYTLFLQGRSLLMRAHTKADWGNVDEYARRAISADVTFAPAWALFSQVLAERTQLGYVLPESGWEAARQAATRSLALDPDLLDGQLAIANIVLRHDWNWAAAQDQIETVMQHDPGNALALVWAGDLALAMRSRKKAISYYEHATAVDPVNPRNYLRLANALYLDLKFDEARIAVHKALTLDADQPFAHGLLARIELAGNQPGTALAQFEQEAYEPLRLAGRAIALHALGREAESDAQLAQLQSRTDRQHYLLALALAARGQAEPAFRQLDEGIGQTDANCLYLGVDPLLAGLRGDSRYAILLRKMGLPLRDAS